MTLTIVGANIQMSCQKGKKMSGWTNGLDLYQVLKVEWQVKHPYHSPVFSHQS